MKHSLMTALVLAGLASCGGPRAETVTADDVKASMKLIDPALEPEAACERWARLLITEPDAVPLTAGTEVAFHGRLTNESKTPVPEPIRGSGAPFEMDFDIDIAERRGDGVRCGGMFMAHVTPQSEETYQLDESVIEKWLAERHVEASKLADGQWLAMYFMDVDLVPHEDGLAASHAFIALESEAYRSGDSTAYYVAWFDDPELEADVDGDGDKEFVIMAAEHEELTSPMTDEYLRQYWGESYEDMGGPPEPGDLLEETTDANALIIHDKEFRFVKWETFNRQYTDNLDETDWPEDGDYELLDLGLGKTVFAWMQVDDMYELQCTKDGKEHIKSIELYDIATYQLLDGDEWDVIFSWSPEFAVGQPCAYTPTEITVSPQKTTGGPWQVHVVHEWDEPETPDRVEIWTFDGEKYRLEDTKTEK